MTGFQTQVNPQPAPAREGSWASMNAKFSMLAGPGALVAGPNGVTVGRFAWADGDGVVRNIGGGGLGRLGFVHEDQVSVIPLITQQSTMIVPAGYEITLFDSADVWARFASGAQIGQKVYANYADGSCYAAAPNSAPSGASATGVIAATTASFTGSITGNLMTVTNVASGTIAIGGTVTGTGVPASEQVLSQVSGTTGGVGIYEVSEAANVVSGALTESYGTLTISGSVTGAFGIGDVLGGSGVAAGSYITAFGTGIGGDGTYIVNNNTAVASTTISALSAVETPWYVDSYAAAGELAMISRRG